jgi:hypothetical protein
MPPETKNDPLTFDKDSEKCRPVLLALNVFERFQRSESLNIAGGEFGFDGHQILSISREQTEKQNLEILLFYFHVPSGWRGWRRDVQIFAAAPSS